MGLSESNHYGKGSKEKRGERPDDDVTNTSTTNSHHSPPKPSIPPSKPERNMTRKHHYKNENTSRTAAKNTKRLAAQRKISCKFHGQKSASATPPHLHNAHACGTRSLHHPLVSADPSQSTPEPTSIHDHRSKTLPHLHSGRTRHVVAPMFFGKIRTLS